MGNNSDYLKDIEKYFLSLAGKGIMLSSMDYSLILEWRNKEIPKEVILKGINRAFENSQKIHGKDASSIRNLKQCVEHINNSIEEFRPIIGKNRDKDYSLDTGDTLANIVNQLNKFIESEKKENIKRHYIDMKEHLLTSADKSNPNILSLCVKIEEESLQTLFMKLSESEREQILLEAKNILGDRARHMTEQALEESIVSFRNEIISNKYCLKNISTLTEDNLE
jgi:hypothetical protein